MARAALAYLRSAQGPDGTTGGSLVSAWSAMAFGAHGERAQDIRAAGGRNLLEGLTAASLVSATDVERQILAVRAAGVDPHGFGGQNLVSILLGRFHDGQLGETSLLNDDMFGILALLAAEVSPRAPEIEQTVSTLLQRQDRDGLWENLDLTAAAIQALRAYGARGGRLDVRDAVSRARGFLRSHQDRFGGFGENSATTSWGIQAVVALGEDPETWRTPDGATPWTALLRYRNSSGGFGWQSNVDVSPFMTAYAVPALLGIPWPITLLSIAQAPMTLATTSTPTPTATATPSSSPRIAGAAAQRVGSPRSTPPPPRTTAEVVLTDESIQPPRLDTVRADVFASTQIPPGFRPLAPVDRQFAVTAFALSNTGLGLALARILARLRPFVSG